MSTCQSPFRKLCNQAYGARNYPPIHQQLTQSEEMGLPVIKESELARRLGMLLLKGPSQWILVSKDKVQL